jgi:hypothetical protein
MIPTEIPISELTDTELDAVCGGFLNLTLPTVQTNFNVNAVGANWGAITQTNTGTNTNSNSVSISSLPSHPWPVMAI